LLIEQAIDAMGADGEDRIRRPAGLDGTEEERGRQGCHQTSDEARARQRGVGDGGAINIAALNRSTHAIVAGSGAEGGARAAETLELVAGDDLADIKEDRGVGIAQLHYVQQRLPLP